LNLEILKKLKQTNKIKIFKILKIKKKQTNLKVKQKILNSLKNALFLNSIIHASQTPFQIHKIINKSAIINRSNWHFPMNEIFNIKFACTLPIN